MNPPKISLVTACRNAASTIARTMESVAAQAYPNLEWIVMDGASADGTLEILARHRHLIHHLRSAPDEGPYAAINEGMALATGDWIGILSGDDWLAEGALASIAAAVNRARDAKLIACGLQEEPGAYYCDPPGKRFTLLDGLYCQGLNRFYARDALREIGFFNWRRYPKLADRDFYMRWGRKNFPKAVIEKPLYHFRCHEGSISMGGGRSGTVQSLREMRRIAEDWLADPALTPEERALVKDWLCFTGVRLVRFDPLRALPALASAVRRSPGGILRRAMEPRMPKAYRRRPGS